jgi:hypothetical protein
MKRVDRNAMKRAIEEVRRKGGEDLRQIEQKLRDDLGRTWASSPPIPAKTITCN